MAGFQEVKINRSLDFVGASNEEANISGIPMTKKVILDDHFTSGFAEADWLQGTQGSTWADGTGLGGTLTCTTGGNDDDEGELYRVAHFAASKNCGMEARVKIDVITAVGINVGFTDAYHNTNDQINYELNSSNALVNGRSTDGAAFVFDTDAGTDVWFCAAVKADAEGTPVAATGTRAPVADTYAELRVQLDTSGNATFYYNGEAVGYRPASTTASATLTPYVAVIARSAAARILTIDRVTVWQDE